jgi:hypothetical protein
MTVTTTGDGGAVVPYDPEAYGDVGLEDVGVADVVIPRLSIVHDEGVFQDNLSKARYDKLTVILLGLVKQRIFWDDTVDDGDKPMCKSPDFELGFPQVSEEVKADKRFPWDKSNFNPADFPPGGPTSVNGLVTLPCSSCVFKEWDKQDWKVPPCTEQHTYPLLYTPDEGQSWTAALLSLQKTGIKPSRQYISSFAQSKTPMFTVFTELSLTQQSRGSVKYSVPVLRKGTQTEREDWSNYADTYRSIREFVRQPPRSLEEDEGVPTEAAAATAAPATTAPAPAPAAPAPAAAVPSSPPPGPDAPGSSTPAPAAPAAPAAAPTAPAAPTAEAAAPVAPAPAAPEAPAVAPPTEDLPF